MFAKHALAILVTACVLAATPAQAQNRADAYRSAPFPGNGAQARGVFAGADMRLELGGQAGPAPRIAMRIAPLVRQSSPDWPASIRIGEGLALTFASERKLQVMLAGRSLREVAGSAVPEGQRSNLSTGATIAIAGGVIVVGIAAFVVARRIDRRNEET